MADDRYEDRLRGFIEGQFKAAPNTEKTAELREEITQDLTERYRDLVAGGKSPEEAYAAAAESAGDVQGLIRELFGTQKALAKLLRVPEEHGFSAAGIDSLRIDWVSGMVSVALWDGEEISLTEHARRALRDREKLVCEIDGATLCVRYVERGFIGVTLPTKSLEVLLPRAMTLTRLSANTASADVKLSGLRAGELSVRTASGDVALEDIAAGAADLRTASGDVRLGGAEIKDLAVNTASGDMGLAGDFESVRLNTASGDAKLQLHSAPKSINCTAVSGDLSLRLPETPGLSVSHRAVSGDFHCDMPVMLQKKDAMYQFKSVSGDVRIQTEGKDNGR